MGTVLWTVELKLSVTREIKDWGVTAIGGAQTHTDVNNNKYGLQYQRSSNAIMKPNKSIHTESGIASIRTYTEQHKIHTHEYVYVA